MEDAKSFLLRSALKDSKEWFKNKYAKEAFNLETEEQLQKKAIECIKRTAREYNKDIEDVCLEDIRFALNQYKLSGKDYILNLNFKKIKQHKDTMRIWSKRSDQFLTPLLLILFKNIPFLFIFKKLYGEKIINVWFIVFLYVKLVK